MKLHNRNTHTEMKNYENEFIHFHLYELNCKLVHVKFELALHMQCILYSHFLFCVRVCVQVRSHASV